ncbi:MAG: ribonuclease HII [Peptococcaceae bacterium]|jgi:ribonuclease HII|nr:ribonuclease HII [Peptococcaceae bacterium]MDH7525685.1 ribonuclease HII [Peptococcaceae bacterium]
MKMEKQKAEKERLYRLWEWERSLWTAGYSKVAGLDEAGRGPLAGPVVAASVVLPPEIEIPGLNDSKKLSGNKRSALAEIIKQKALAWGVGVVDQSEIDRINILQASKIAMIEAVRQMGVRPDFLLIDALTVALDIPQQGIVHGDTLSASIAAASIIAKTHRDSLMEMMDVLYPEYGFKDHKGYGTPRHLEALRCYGPCPIHRVTFIHKMNKTRN